MSNQPSYCDDMGFNDLNDIQISTSKDLYGYLLSTVKIYLE